MKDTILLTIYRSNIPVDISNHDEEEEEGEAEEAARFEVIFVVLECQMWKAGRKGSYLCSNGSRVFSVFE